jgi:hypothetical protein
MWGWTRKGRHVIECNEAIRFYIFVHSHGYFALDSMPREASSMKMIYWHRPQAIMSNKVQIKYQ